ncbi:MAG: hypothetical protein ACI835_003983 [Planctomycetota bacterium]|jgi:hypothetical protein
MEPFGLHSPEKDPSMSMTKTQVVSLLKKNRSSEGIDK